MIKTNKIDNSFISNPGNGCCSFHVDRSFGGWFQTLCLNGKKEARYSLMEEYWSFNKKIRTSYCGEGVEYELFRDGTHGEMNDGIGKNEYVILKAYNPIEEEIEITV